MTACRVRLLIPRASSLQGFAVAPGSAPATYTLYASFVCHFRTFDDQYGIVVYDYNTNHRCYVRHLSKGIESTAKKLQQVVGSRRDFRNLTSVTVMFNSGPSMSTNYVC